jgi:hypothetical protein
MASVWTFEKVRRLHTTKKTGSSNQRTIAPPRRYRIQLRRNQNAIESGTKRVKLFQKLMPQQKKGGSILLNPVSAFTSHQVIYYLHFQWLFN